MTAEVAVMNPVAVALAADSAMSVGRTGKTYPTDKLFALSRHHPVGMMVYNNASFMGVPWETLVKMYRQTTDAKGKAKVGDYATAFLDHINSDKICTEQARAANVVRIAQGLFEQIVAELDNPAVSDAGPRESEIDSIIQRHTDRYLEAGVLPCMEDFDADELVRTHEAELDSAMNQCFGTSRVSTTVRQALYKSVAAAINSAQLSDGSFGLVFAGFGEEEIFPSLVEIVTDGPVGNVVKAYTKGSVDIDRAGVAAAVLPFAQSEMVGRFMDGVDPNFIAYLRRFFEGSLVRVARELIGEAAQAGHLTEQQLPELLNIVRSNLDDLEEAIFRFRRQRFNRPILDIVRFLPKAELASMAEALVSLTSLKRRVSMEEESVGGPIDVGVISKGDGFVWIKRKHYFDPALNRDYLARHAGIQTISRANP